MTELLWTTVLGPHHTIGNRHRGRKFHAALCLDRALRAVLLALVDTLCELLEATSSVTDEEEPHQNIFNAFLDFCTGCFHVGDSLEAYLPEEESGRDGWSYHFALDCLCQSILPTSLILEQDVRASFFFAFHSDSQHALFPPDMTLCAAGCLLGPPGLTSADSACQAGPVQLWRIGPVYARDSISLNTRAHTFSEGVIIITFIIIWSNALEAKVTKEKRNRRNEQIPQLMRCRRAGRTADQRSRGQTSARTDTH